MKTLIKPIAVLLAAAIISGGVAAFSQDSRQSSWPPTAWEWPGNNFTNNVVVPTVGYYGKNQAAVANDQQDRVRQGGTGKGGAALQTGPRIEPRAPTTYVQADPWVQRDHPWDVNPFLPISESPGSTNSTVIDRTLKR
ncbi:MAG TPA: hypothetical protein VH280_07475 [Verrucomicrobiae bacterium]|jgi:hypothetical protein|nr:hypothetical protein [Verrucomicrobiae bacterium]